MIILTACIVILPETVTGQVYYATEVTPNGLNFLQ